MGRLKSLPKTLSSAPPVLAAPDRSQSERQRDRVRAKKENSLRGLYNTARWRHPVTGLRVQTLNRDGWMCRGCAKPHVLGGPKHGPNSAVVDHIQPHGGNLALFWDPENLQSVCKSYHDTTKQAQEAAERSNNSGQGWG